MGAEVLIALLGALGLVGGILIFLLFVAFLNPDKAQRWAEMAWALIGKVWHAGRKRAVQHGVQASLTNFAQDLASQTGRPAADAKIEWTRPDEKVDHFMQDNRVVIRLHSYERQDRNLMTASLLYVSDTLVRRAKRYLSKRQARSVDLYAVDRLLTRTAPASADLLHEEILGPECDSDRELADLIVEYQKMDHRLNAFFPIFIRELNYLAHKVVVKPKGDQLIADVKELHRFLVRYADRTVGEDMPAGVQGRFLRCAVMIVARAPVREKGRREPYMRHLNDLNRAGYETIYVVGSAAKENRDFLLGITRDFCKASGWSEVYRRGSDAILRHLDGSETRTRNQLIVLRSNQARDYIGEADEVAFPPEVAGGESAG